MLTDLKEDDGRLLGYIYSMYLFRALFCTFQIISNNNIGHKGAIALFEVIKTSDSLISLDVSGNKIGDRAAEAIGTALTENIKLQKLNLSDNG